MNTKTKLLILTVFIAFTVPSWALEEDPVKKKYAERLAAARKEYLDSVEKIRIKMLAEYQKYLKVALKRKDLDMANEINEKIEFLKEKKADTDKVEKEVPPKKKEPPEVKTEEVPVNKDGFEAGVPKPPE